MTPRKKERTRNPETITSPMEDDSNICSESQESCCPDSCAVKDDENSSC